MPMFVLLQVSHILHKIYSNALPFRNVVLGGNEKLWTQIFFMIKVLFYGNDMVHFMKIYTTSHSHYHLLASTAKRVILVA